MPINVNQLEFDFSIPIEVTEVSAPAKKIMDRRFIAFDGEGYTDEKGQHHYYLLGYSDGETSTFLKAAKGWSLSQLQIANFLMQAREKYPNSFYVIYGGNYDFNMMLRGNGIQEHIVRVETVKFNNFYWTIRPGRYMEIRPYAADGGPMIIYDVLAFFQTSFVNACTEYLGDDFFEREHIVENKNRRSFFQYEDSDEIQWYCHAELVNLVRLMNELRNRLYQSGMLVSRWYGPGAIASKMLQENKIKEAMSDTYHHNVEVYTAARYAYAGGRFEMLKFGHVQKPAYEYDINSAYPFAMTKLPDLSRGQWRLIEGDAGDHPFAMYHVKYSGDNLRMIDLPQPLPQRFSKGGCNYPYNTTTWIWSPEMEALRKYYQKWDIDFTVLETWVFDAASNRQPFDFIPRYYENRLTLQRLGSGAHIGIKLGLNSLYGKLAQQLGWKEGKPLPPFHQLEWAGYVTSHCRAQILEATIDNLDAVIAYQTDAVFTTRPLDLPLSKQLGEWSEIKLNEFTYVQSGVYFGITDEGEIQKSRGFAKSIGIDPTKVHEAWQAGIPSIRIPHETFVTLGLARGKRFKQWGNWIRDTRELAIHPSKSMGKRIHSDNCWCGHTDPNDYYVELGRWHETMVWPYLTYEHSAPYKTLWTDGKNAEQEIREQDYENHDSMELE